MITKEKNLIYITCPNGRKYTFDLNTCASYSGNRLLKSTETIAKNLKRGYYLCLEDCDNNNLVYYILRIGVMPTTQDIKRINIVERCFSIGYDVNKDGLSDTEINILSKHFKEFAKVFNVNKNIRVSTFCEEYLYTPFIKNNGLESLENDLSSWKGKIILKEIFADSDPDKISALKLCSYYTQTGFIPFLNKFFGRSFSLNEFYHYFYEYIKMCKALNKPIYKGNSFMKEFLTTSAEYQDLVDLERTIKITKNQPQNLAYSNDNFVVIVPTTVQEFRNEAKAQDNCVYRLYLDKVVNGETNIVFVRKKDNPNHSYITCEVEDGKIMQYLLAHNNFVNDEKALNFKIEYQNYLNTIYIK